ncbi:hypothetical protein A2U01_0097226, partial [Trifolium medium]|nr:hypothetical protein [Trifolium medium]
TVEITRSCNEAANQGSTVADNISRNYIADCTG